MPLGARGPIARRRPFPAASYELSVLALSLGPVGAGVNVDATLALLRRAAAAGITTFDLVETPEPALAETLLARAFPEGDPRIVVVCRLDDRGGDLSPARGPRPPAPRKPRTAALPGRDVGGHDRFPHLLEVEAAELRPGSALSAGATALGTTPVVVRCHSVDDVVGIASRPPPWMLSGPFSLLDQALPRAAERSLGAGAFTWIARDLFAGGRLDGSRFAGGSMPARAALPPTLRELEAEFGPVARLGSLARPRERTLAQAALGFVLGHPWVVTACLSAPPPERWEEIVGFASAPPLTDEELKRVAAVGGAEHPSAVRDGGLR